MENFGTQFRNWVKTDGKYLAIALMCGTIVTATAAFSTKNYADKTQKNIANNVIRLHVKANSDSESDQALKLKVRDDVLSEFSEVLQKAPDVNSARETILSNIDAIQKCAQKSVLENGYNYPVNVSVVREQFPTKFYGDIAMPPGEYEALKINIGEAYGQNWWCVLYPPLCYVDATKSQVSSSTKNNLKQNLSEDEYNLITTSKKDDIKIKFKIVELWNKK